MMMQVVPGGMVVWRTGVPMPYQFPTKLARAVLRRATTVSLNGGRVEAGITESESLARCPGPGSGTGGRGLRDSGSVPVTPSPGPGAD
jgi:hypothetical protein